MGIEQAVQADRGLGGMPRLGGRPRRPHTQRNRSDTKWLQIEVVSVVVEFVIASRVCRGGLAHLSSTACDSCVSPPPSRGPGTGLCVGVCVVLAVAAVRLRATDNYL